MRSCSKVLAVRVLTYLFVGGTPPNSTLNSNLLDMCAKFLGNPGKTPALSRPAREGFPEDLTELARPPGQGSSPGGEDRWERGARASPGRRGCCPGREGLELRASWVRAGDESRKNTWRKVPEDLIC